MSERADDLREKLDVERARADALEEERRSWAKSVLDLEAQRDLCARACGEARAERDALAQVLSDLLKEQHPKAAERLAPEWVKAYVEETAQTIDEPGDPPYVNGLVSWKARLVGMGPVPQALLGAREVRVAFAPSNGWLFSALLKGGR